MFKVKTSASLGIIMKVYAKRIGVCDRSLSFLLDRYQIDPTATCAELDLEDGDQLDVFLMQSGC